jgi:hypothetical protein
MIVAAGLAATTQGKEGGAVPAAPIARPPPIPASREGVPGPLVAHETALDPHPEAPKAFWPEAA